MNAKFNLKANYSFCYVYLTFCQASRLTKVSRQLPEPNPQPMRGAVIDEFKPQWPVRKDGFVEGSEGDAAPNAIGIFYRDFVLGRTVSQREFEARPGFRDAGSKFLRMPIQIGAS